MNNWIVTDRCIYIEACLIVFGARLIDGWIPMCFRAKFQYRLGVYNDIDTNSSLRCGSHTVRTISDIIKGGEQMDRSDCSALMSHVHDKIRLGRWLNKS
jgi:hypothetical protein